MDALETLRRREWTIAWVRWSAAALAAGQIVFGGDIHDALTVTILVVLAVVGFAVAAADRRLVTAAAWRRAAAVLMGIDAVATLGLVWAGLLVRNDSLWVLLVLLTLEGALRYRLRGAVVASAGGGAAYLLLEAAVGAGATASELATRLLFLLIVGGFAGSIARELDVERRLYQRMAEASQDIVAQRDETAILGAVARHVNEALDARRTGVYHYALAGFDERVGHGSVDGGDGAPLLDAQPDGISAILHRITWRQGRGASANLLTIPVRLPERPAEWVVAVELTRPRPTALAEGALLALAESCAVTLATRDLIRSQEANNRRLERLEALRTRFVATVAHDLRSPLTTVKGVAKILRGRRDQVPPERVDQMLESVERQANRLNRLADDLLDAARVDSDQLELNRSTLDVEAVLRTVVADATDHVELVVEPGLHAHADGARLERVVWNLLSNASKYGKPPVRVTARADGEDLVVSVRDHGAGLTQPEVDRMFEDFATSGAPDSVGLGLAIVWELADAHGGEVSYRHADPGAEFTVRIPAAVRQRPSAAEAELPLHP